MSEKAGPQSRNSVPSAGGPFTSSFDAAAKLKSFLNQLGATSFAGQEKSWLSRAVRLHHCSERALDAHTLEEALTWETQIVGELTQIIIALSQEDWPLDRKCAAMFDLMHQRIRHTMCIKNIEFAIRRNEKLDWLR